METESRNTTLGALVALLAGTGVLIVIDLHLPYAGAWALNTTVILGSAGGIAWYKRSPLARACVCVLAAVCAASPILALTGAVTGILSDADLGLAVVMVVAWYWLLRAGVRRPAPVTEPQVVHHIHHVVHDGGAAVPAAVPVPAPRVTVPGRVERPAIAPVGARRHLRMPGVLTVSAETPEGPLPMGRAVADLAARAGLKMRRPGVEK